MNVFHTTSFFDTFNYLWIMSSLNNSGVFNNETHQETMVHFSSPDHTDTAEVWCFFLSELTSMIKNANNRFGFIDPTMTLNRQQDDQFVTKIVQIARGDVIINSEFVTSEFVTKLKVRAHALQVLVILLKCFRNEESWVDMGLTVAEDLQNEELMKKSIPLSELLTLAMDIKTHGGIIRFLKT